MSLLPQAKRGRKSPGQSEKERLERYAFAERLIEIQSTLDYKMGGRDWCYYIEGQNLVDKSEFDQCERLINDLRKDPDSPLPIGFTLEDGSRSADCVPWINTVPADYYGEWLVGQLQSDAERFTPYPLSDTTGVHIEVVVEKNGLRSLFHDICTEYQTPITNAKGQSDINSRADIMRRMVAAGAERNVILYCGDHDPKGLHLADAYIKGLRDLEPKLCAEGTDADGLSESVVFDHIGLHFAFIEQHGFLWIDNLITGRKTGINDLANTKHPDHFKPYVQEYVATYGVRKCEANALVAQPEVGRQLILDAINEWVSRDQLDEYRTRIENERSACFRAVQAELESAYGA